jgi:hypothetical protein
VAVVLLAVVATRTASALDSETFDDYKSVGAAADARSTPAVLSIDGHGIDPTLKYKVFDLITPHIFGSETVGYSDNIFHDESDGTHTPYLRTSVGGRGDIQLDNHVFSLGYTASESNYLKSSERDDLFEQKANGRLDLNFNEFQVHGEAAYERTGYPASIQLQGLAVENVYSGQGWVEGSWDKIGGKVGFSFRRDDFVASANSSFDHDTIGVDAEAFFKVTEKVKATAEYDFEALRFDQSVNRDYDAHQVRFGATGALTEKFALSAKIGYTYQVVLKNTGDFQDGSHYSGFDAAVAASWQPTTQLTFGAAYRRDLTWAVGANFETVDYLDLTGTYRFGPEDKLSATLDFNYSHGVVDDNKGGHEDHVHGQATFDWKVQKWLDAQVFYSYDQVLAAGAVHGSEYDEHKVGVSLAAGF